MKDPKERKKERPMKRILLLICILLTSFVLLPSQNLIITKIDGSTIEIPISDIESMTYSDGLVIPAKKVKDSYSIGDTGPAGGIIFYDKGSYSEGWRYLEAAPASAEGKDKIMEGDFDFFFLNTTEGIGGGRSNTLKIMERQKKEGPKQDKALLAATYCSELVQGGYDDWSLPSRDELNLMYQNLHTKGLGGFSDSYYWASSEYDGINVWYQNFEKGTQYVLSRDWDLYVRPIRYF